MIHQFDIVSGTVKIRAELPELITRQKALQHLEGRRFFFEVLSMQDEGDKYPGEWMLGPAHAATEEAMRNAGIAWISSGDVVIDDE